MKKKIFLHIIALITVLGLAFVSASSFIFSPMTDDVLQKSYAQKMPVEYFSAKNSIRSESSIEVLWPEAGYYYVTDYMELLIRTESVSDCTYSFDDSNPEALEFSNNTTHVHYLFNLADNMASEQPYVVDFYCKNEANEESTAETWFWINTTPLDSYLIRANIGNWKYKAATLIPVDESELSNGLSEMYISIYDINESSLYAFVDVDLFDNENSVKNFINNSLNDSEINYSINSIEGENVYVSQGNYTGLAFWNNKDKVIIAGLIAENLTLASNEAFLEIVREYLKKYPSELRDGVCGDGKVNILNQEGKKEECDKNAESAPCGSNVGECKRGAKIRECKSDCTWDMWGACNATTPMAEKCDGKDNDCDAKTDEDFALLGDSCFVGNGTCKEEGKYICSSNGLNVTCNAVPEESRKENCIDGKDNDCDGLVDFQDNDCIPMEIFSPTDGFVYSNKKILLNILAEDYADELSYSYIDNKGKEIKVRLCSGCYSYNKSKSFKDGDYNLTFLSLANRAVVERKQLNFIIDSTTPKVYKTQQKSRFTNGLFDVVFAEKNLDSVILHYDNSSKKIDSATCNKTKEKIYCSVNINLTDLDGKEVTYFFEIKDIAGNKATSKPISLTVDTTQPKLNSFNWSINKNSVRFVLNVTEKNFDKITFIDWKDKKPSEKTLCSRLKYGMCEITKNFRIGEHNITVYVKDKASNVYQKDILFSM